MEATRLDAGLYWLLMGGLGGVWLGDKLGRPLLGASVGAGSAALFMPHIHADYGCFEGAQGCTPDDGVGAFGDGIAAHPEDTGTSQPGIGYYAVPALLGGVAGATAGEGKQPKTRLLITLLAGGGAALLAYVVKPKPLPAARNSDQELAWEGIIQAEKDTFGNVIAISLWGPLTYWSATKAKHPLLALALMGGGVAMITGAARNIVETRQLRRRFIRAVARSGVSGVDAVGAADTGSPSSEISRAQAAVGKLQRVATPQVLQMVADVDDEAERAIRRTVRDAPSFLFDTIATTALKAAAKIGDRGVQTQLADVVADTDASNLTEARQGISAIGRIVGRSRAVRDLTNSALAVLEKQGILGRGFLSSLTVLLGSVAAGAAVQKQVKGGQLQLVTPNASLSVSRIGNYSARLRLRNPAWSGNAITVALSGSAQTKFRARISMAPARTVESFELAAPIPLRVKTRGGSRVVALTPYYRGSAVDKTQEGGAKLAFKF